MKKTATTTSKLITNKKTVKVVRKKKPTCTPISPAETDGFSKMNDPHICMLQGPILFTAPHGIRVYRGGTKEDPTEKKRIHKEEVHTSELCVKLALAITKHLPFAGSFVIWNWKIAKECDEQNLDPNYLLASQFASSPWHQALHQFKQKFASMPLLHIDVHGKKNRENNRDLDLGMNPMECLWPKQLQFAKLKQVLHANLSKAVQNGQVYDGAFKFAVEAEPVLHGYWGDDTNTTMSHQSILLGIPAAQLEIPLTMRKALMSDGKFLDQFASAIANTYKQVMIEQQMFGPSEAVSSAVFCLETTALYEKIITEYAALTLLKSSSTLI